MYITTIQNLIRKCQTWFSFYCWRKIKAHAKVILKLEFIEFNAKSVLTVYRIPCGCGSLGTEVKYNYSSPKVTPALSAVHT